MALTWLLLKTALKRRGRATVSHIITEIPTLLARLSNYWTSAQDALSEQQQKQRRWCYRGSDWLVTLQTPTFAWVEQTDRPTQSKGLKKKRKKERKNKILSQLKLEAFVRTHIAPLNPTDPSLNLPACPDLVVSRIILYLYLNTHKAYTGKGTTTQEKQGYTQSWERWNSKIKKEKTKQTNQSYIKQRLRRLLWWRRDIKLWIFVDQDQTRLGHARPEGI